MAKATLVLFLTCCFAETLLATLLHQIRFELFQGKAVKHYDRVLINVSKLQCASQCQEMQVRNKTCNMAGYNEVTRSCFIRNGLQSDILSNPSQTSIVMVIEDIDQPGNVATYSDVTCIFKS